MAVISTGKLTLPADLHKNLIQLEQDDSVVARLRPAENFKFGDTEFVSLDSVGEAEFVGESQPKSSIDAAFGGFVAKTRKAHIGIRISQEVQWASEDDQLNQLGGILGALGVKIRRALDFGVIHATNPRTGYELDGAPAHIAGTSYSRTQSAKFDEDIEAAVSLLIEGSDGRVIPNGVAMDAVAAHGLRGLRDTTGRRLYPDVPLDPRALGNFDGLSIAVGETVRGRGVLKTAGDPEAEPPTEESPRDSKVLALLGDWQKGLRWGVAREIGLTVIPYGDPDNTGRDLAGHNEILVRAEVAYVWYVDPTRFAKVVAP